MNLAAISIIGIRLDFDDDAAAQAFIDAAKSTHSDADELIQHAPFRFAFDGHVPPVFVGYSVSTDNIKNPSGISIPAEKDIAYIDIVVDDACQRIKDLPSNRSEVMLWSGIHIDDE